MYMHLNQKFMRHQKYCLNGLWVKKLKVLTHVVVNAFFDKFVEHLPQNKPYGKKVKKGMISTCENCTLEEIGYLFQKWRHLWNFSANVSLVT